MNKSESIKELTKALCKFHSSMGKVSKEAVNPFHKNKYASLPNILDAIQGPLNDSGLCISSCPEGNGMMTTMLMHGESGEYLEFSFDMMAAKKDPQGLGSATTYARRYSIGSLLNLNIDIDDDGENATKGKNDEDSKYGKSYDNDQDLFKLVEGATTVAQLGNLYTLNSNRVEANVELKSCFSNRKRGIETRAKK